MNAPAPAAETTSSSATDSQRGFWQRWLLDPIMRQLTQGVTPERISFTLAIAFTCSLFPFLGFTWILNLGVGIALRLNQPIMQTLNQLMTPIHLPMIFVYVRIGEWIWQAHEQPFSVVEMLQNFAALTLTELLHKFGWAGVHAFSGWIITAPLVFVVAYLPLRPLVRRFAQIRFRKAQT